MSKQERVRKRLQKVKYSEIDELIWDCKKYYDIPEDVFIPNVTDCPLDKDPNEDPRVVKIAESGAVSGPRTLVKDLRQEPPKEHCTPSGGYYPTSATGSSYLQEGNFLGGILNHISTNQGQPIQTVPCYLVYYTKKAIGRDRVIDKKKGMYLTNKVFKPKSREGVYLKHQGQWQKLTRDLLLNPNSHEIRKDFAEQLIFETNLHNEQLKKK